MKVGSLCTGYGGLDLAVEAYFDAEMVWCAENDKYASKVIEARFNKPNLNNIKTINWDEVEPIDILTAGYPCQPFSHAGQRKGTEDERHLWPYIIKAISKLRPKYVILENVRGHLSLGFKEVLGDLAQNGYDAKWRIVRASDVGAPHQRARLFIIAYANSDACQESRRAYRKISTKSAGFQRGQNIGQARCEYGCSREIITDTDNSRGFGHMQGLSSRSNSCTTCNTNNQHKSHDGKMSELGRRFVSRREMSMQTSPNTLVDGKLNAKFVEYMMGLPDGWVTDLDLSRAQQLKMLGNGVVPQQAYYALELLHE
jgi:DNA (cytosine-5)-methyltransferase 1